MNDDVKIGFLQNGKLTGGSLSGDAGTMLLNNGMNPIVLRPWFDPTTRRSYITRIENGKPVVLPLINADATLRKDEWKQLDTAIIKAAKPRLKLVGDLRGRGLEYSVPNGMGKTVLETESMGDISDADVSMDPARAAQSDRPEFDLAGLPLPVVHKDFHYTVRQIAASRNGGSPLDTTTAELAARKVSEIVEKMHAGTWRTTAYKYAGYSIYGLTDFTSRLTKVLTDPTDSSWTAKKFVDEVLAMRQQSIDNYYYGPWVMYVGSGWSQYLDDDYKDYSDITLRRRVEQIDGIESVQTLDYLDSTDVVLVQMTSDVVRTVVGMEIVTVQWDELGGMRKHFKVMCIMVPQVRADFNGNTGIVHGYVQ